MCLVTAGLAEKFVINSLNCAVLMGEANLFCRVALIKNGCAKALDVNKVSHRSGLNRLSAAVYAAPGQPIISMKV